MKKMRKVYWNKNTNCTISTHIRGIGGIIIVNLRQFISISSLISFDLSCLVCFSWCSKLFSSSFSSSSFSIDIHVYTCVNKITRQKEQMKWEKTKYWNKKLKMVVWKGACMELKWNFSSACISSFYLLLSSFLLFLCIN